MTLVPGVSDGRGQCSAQVCGVGCGEVAITDSVGDLITDDDSIRFLRGTPSEHYRGEHGLTNEVRHSTRNCI